MNLSKFIQRKILSRLLVLYVFILTFFLVISFHGLKKETDRFFSMASDYIFSSTQQLINEGQSFRIQMNIDQFSRQINKNSEFKICSTVYLDTLLIASVECNGHFFKSKKIQFLMNDSRQLLINLKIDYESFIYYTVFQILFFSILSFISFIFIKRSIDYFAIEITTPLSRWSKWSQDLISNNEIPFPDFLKDELEIYEFKIFNEYTKTAFLIQKEYYSIKIDQEKNRIITDLAVQLSHDIRSPLSALKMALEEMDNVPSGNYQVINSSIQRIKDIANNVLITDRNKDVDDCYGPTSVSFLVDSLVTDKRMEYRASEKVVVKKIFENSYGLFIIGNKVELTRVLSNLINNSFEAIDEIGEITIKVSKTAQEKILISIQDNGKGIPDFVLKNIGNEKKSYGKSEGNGLGMVHAKNIIESLDGEMEVLSITNQGTICNIYLPSFLPPPWFFSELILYPNNKVFLIADDKSSLNMWRKLLPVENRLLVNFENFKDVYDKEIIVFIDYEYLDHCFEFKNIVKKCKAVVLITDQFENKDLQKMHYDLGIYLTPKVIFPTLPVVLKMDSSKSFYDYVYIDDEVLLRMSWESKAKKSNIKLLTLDSIKDFWKFSDDIDKWHTHIYIDSDLGNGQEKGEDFAQELHLEGYQNIYIASGYEDKKFEHLPWLKVAGKKRPF